jgi:hypothetical protein
VSILLSGRKTKEIESIYAVVVKDKHGKEGVVRRDTPYGTIPWTTDDPALAEKMRALALESYSNYADPEAFYLVRFDRVKP